MDAGEETVADAVVSVEEGVVTEEDEEGFQEVVDEEVEVIAEAVVVGAEAHLEVVEHLAADEEEEQKVEQRP